MITSYCVHTRRRSQVEIDPLEGSPKVDFRMVLVLRSEELARTAHIGVQPAHGLCAGPPYFKVSVAHMVGSSAANFALIFSTSVANFEVTLPDRYFSTRERLLKSKTDFFQTLGLK